MKIEMWNGYKIRFIEIDDEWYAVLKDVCDAIGLRTSDVSQRLDSTMIKYASVLVEKPHFKTSKMIVVNEIGIYETLFASRKPEAQKFRRWSFGVLKKLRRDRNSVV